ncbi:MULTISPECIES: hypothetical protein [unclassified Pseudomonas]|uniref:hypothetical protein n=1 Tax=unclassified Pseudomonas TaxID=196821 RepID=UPI0011AFBFE1|nr:MULTISPECIES: hypothetical protein [unclassified Pseudomonas]
MTSENRRGCTACSEKGELKCVCVPVTQVSDNTSSVNKLSQESTRIVTSERFWFDRILDLLKIGIGLANLILGLSKN